LLAKVQKLSEDLLRARDPTAAGGGTRDLGRGGRGLDPPVNTPQMILFLSSAGHQKDEDTDDLIEELRNQVKELSKENTQTRAKGGAKRRQVSQHSTNRQRPGSRVEEFEVERTALQLEISAGRKVEKELRGKVNSLDERLRALTEAHQDALSTSEKMNADLKDERRKVVELEHEIKKMDISLRENDELREIVKDLREEKALLEEEQERLLSAQFSREREHEYQNEIEELQSRLAENTRDLSKHLDEKSNLHSELQDLKDKLRLLREDMEDSNRERFEIQSERDELRDKVAFLTQDGAVDLSEVEEALSFVRLRREKGISLDFLFEVDDLLSDKKLLEDLRVQHADCVHELEKTRKLLLLQEHINRDYKLEVESLNQKLEALKNGYGQNLIEIHIEAALISDDGLHFLRKIGLDREDANKIVTFASYDFFEFETQVSPTGLGQRPVFNFTSRYTVFTDDFFLQYLQSSSITLSFCISNGTEFLPIATCPMVLKELTDPDRTDRLRYYADLISTHDGRTIIGKIDYGLRVRLPMAQAIRSFKERTVALNLLTVADQESSSRRFRSRAETNDLVVRLIQAFNLRPPPGRRPAVFASFQFYIHPDIATDTVHHSTSPLLNFMRVLPLPMTADLDRYLRTAAFEVLVVDDNDGLDDHVYGTCRIPLAALALGESLGGEFDLLDEFGLAAGSITISMVWSKSYKPSVTPLVSKVFDGPAGVVAARGLEAPVHPTPESSRNSVNSSARHESDPAPSLSTSVADSRFAEYEQLRSRRDRGGGDESNSHSSHHDADGSEQLSFRPTTASASQESLVVASSIDRSSSEASLPERNIPLDRPQSSSRVASQPSSSRPSESRSAVASNGSTRGSAVGSLSVSGVSESRSDFHPPTTDTSRLASSQSLLTPRNSHASSSARSGSSGSLARSSAPSRGSLVGSSREPIGSGTLEDMRASLHGSDESIVPIGTRAIGVSDQSLAQAVEEGSSQTLASAAVDQSSQSLPSAAERSRKDLASVNSVDHSLDALSPVGRSLDTIGSGSAESLGQSVPVGDSTPSLTSLAAGSSRPSDSSQSLAYAPRAIPGQEPSGRLVHSSEESLSSEAERRSRNSVTAVDRDQRDLFSSDSLARTSAESLESDAQEKDALLSSSESLLRSSAESFGATRTLAAEVALSTESVVDTSTEILVGDSRNDTSADSLRSASAESLGDAAAAGGTTRGGFRGTRLDSIMEDEENTTNSSSRSSNRLSSAPASEDARSRSSSASGPQGTDASSEAGSSDRGPGRRGKGARSFRVSVRAVEIHVDKTGVRNAVRRARQFFVSVGFLSFDPEQLETHSFPNDESGHFPVSFSKKFEFKDADDRKAIARAARSPGSSGSFLTFTLVAEPPTGAANASCEDVAVAKVPLRTLLDARGDQLAVDLRLKDVDADSTAAAAGLEVGSVRVAFAGLEFLRQLCKDSS
ncbi:X-linked retinitis pigmentosa GTPase regulator-interacting protein 1, partial [Cladochytrium tenue]